MWCITNYLADKLLEMLQANSWFHNHERVDFELQFKDNLVYQISLFFKQFN